MTPEELVEEFTASLPYPLDDFQLEAIRALASGHSVLVAAPTGTGKTVIAEFGIFQARTAGLRAIYTTPIKALSNQKFRDFRARWGGDEVGLLTGDISRQLATRRSSVMTTEVLRNMLVTGATHRRRRHHRLRRSPLHGRRRARDGLGGVDPARAAPRAAGVPVGDGAQRRRRSPSGSATRTAT